MKIAILDPRINAPGLTKLFPEADYYIVKHNGNYDLDKTPDRFRATYGFAYREDLESITGDQYDALFIVYAVHDFKDKRRKTITKHHFKHIMKVLGRSTFKKVVVFANDDNALNPVESCPKINADVWFKRNYQSSVVYPENVHPFPFVMFGRVCPLWRFLTENHTSTEKFDRVIWAGNVYKKWKTHKYRNKTYLSRYKIYNSKIKNYLTTIQAPNDIYLQAITTSKFALDINGIGDPNYRTFELLTTDTLILQQFKDLVWPFDEGDRFSQETIYRTPDEFIENLEKLRNSEELYNKALTNQQYIKNKYFQADWLRNYLMTRIFPEG